MKRFIKLQNLQVKINVKMPMRFVKKEIYFPDVV